MVVHTAVCLAGVLPEVTVEACVCLLTQQMVRVVLLHTVNAVVSAELKQNRNIS